MRVAIYWAPAVADPLTALGNTWLGRDPETNVALGQPQISNIEELTRAPRHYGFHCTLRPPMRLATAWHEFHAAARRVAATVRPFQLPPLVLREVDGFLALTLAHRSSAIQALADECVRQTEPCRLAAPADELARRRAAGLSPRQEDMLQRWGYPYVMTEWYFHLTLTRRLSPAEYASILPAARQHFAAALEVPRMVQEICIFTQSGGDFLIAERLAL
jgi:hypothetical protein